VRVPGRHALLRDDAVPVAAIILAAGAGSRYGGGEPKLIADLGGRPLLEHVVAAAHPVAALERIVVVLGDRAKEVFEHVDFLDAEPVLCPDWADGQSASLRRGVEALAGSEKVLVLLGDQPLVTTATIARMAG
jgi:CTP:molybdopterin cytidylyltransferase MocA